jgi:hypothetical protein
VALNGRNRTDKTGTVDLCEHGVGHGFAFFAYLPEELAELLASPVPPQRRETILETGFTNGRAPVAEEETGRLD